MTVPDRRIKIGCLEHVCFLLLLRPKLQRFLCALTLFLFTFQVHANAIMLPVTPLLVHESVRAVLFVNVGLFRWSTLLYICELSESKRVLTNCYNSMWPLLKRDGCELSSLLLLVT